MTPLVWDKVSERFYQTGIDRGVLYLHDGTVAVWNGLTSIEESSTSEVKSYHLDGVKYLEVLSPGDFSAKLKAITYPEEFDSVNGSVDLSLAGAGSPSPVAPGLTVHDQPAKSFDMSYRTMIGNDLEPELGYRIHLLYNVIANPDSFTFSTNKDQPEIAEFGWTLTGTPSKLTRFRPTVHVSIDSNDTPQDILKLLEDTLYGTATSNPRLPPMQDIGEFFGYLGALLIVDHGDGTWSALDESDSYITMLDSTTFQIDDADATYLDTVTYELSSTNITE